MQGRVGEEKPLPVVDTTIKKNLFKKLYSFNL
jgi:hypothetical protein